MGNIGQADYSTANAFMDAYATYRNNLLASRQCWGKTISFNWPLWREGGMNVDAQAGKLMQQSTGMAAMKTLTGIQSFYQGLTSEDTQVLVLEGDLPKMQAYFLESLPKLHLASIVSSISGVTPQIVKEKTLHQLKILFGETAKMDFNLIDSSEPLESYGIGSIMIIQLNQKLADIFSGLPSTLFFEYQTIGELAEYLFTEYPQECLQWTGLGSQVQPEISLSMLESKSEFSVLTMNQGKQQYSNIATDPSAREHESIAIIGMSCRYPQAKTLKDYWENLKTGKDSIREIPEERWSLEGFFHPDPLEAASQGKSYGKWGGFIEGFANFDPIFFNISPRDALNMDPQERLFLESCWEVLEDAGYTKEQLATLYQGRIGVFAGITKTGYSLYGPELWKQGERVFPNTSFSSMANRVSYLLNLRGPSMPIDTMCSSSLTAIHEASEYLRRGECEMAIAGGVNLYLHPSNYIGLSAQQMLSSDGRCKSFGKGGNGFVPGEGVGTILLKRLSQAIEDRDNIYAVIRGTSINHGGKTNGYTVPNPAAQAEVIRAALDKAGVNARAVSYIEAHGTGTELGDPIEIAGLTQAFRKDTQAKEYCAIGSVKSNIGHLEAAAGMAGIAKIVLQMQHKMLAPSLHAEELNPNINFAQTPFVVQRTLAEWKRPVDETGYETVEYPRIAGISSFGAGGSNAHIVLEEYIPPSPQRTSMAVNAQNLAIIVLSAKSEERLIEHAQQLVTVIEERQYTETELADVAYTLQIGREAMEERLALVVGSTKELQDKLKDFVAGRGGIEDLYRGQIKRNKETMSVLAVDEEMQETISKWIQRRKYGNLLDLWVKGLSIDWNKIYGDHKPRRISLPTYPFADECYWIVGNTDTRGQTRANISAISSVIHPLLQQNTSDLSEQRFTSTFKGEEFFLANHVVKGQRVMPGVGYLEMARIALVMSAKIQNEGINGIQLKNVVWATPIIVGNQPVQVHIAIRPEATGEISYEVYSSSTEVGIEPVVHSQGRAVLSPLAEVSTIDLKALQVGCSLGTLSAGQCYESFRALGFDYGPGHQGLEKVFLGEDQVLAKLVLPSSVSGTDEEFVLHPSMMDSALQASIGLMISSGEHRPVLPFALQGLEVYGRCTSEMWAHIRHSKESKFADRIQKLDIDLCDETGKICVRMKGFSSRVLEGKISLAGLRETTGTLMFEPCWQERAVPFTPKRKEEALDFAQHLVMLCELSEISKESIAARIDRVADEFRCIALYSQEKEIDKRFQAYTVQLFEEVQKILTERPNGNVLLQIVISAQSEQQLFSGMAGLLKTAQLENPKFIGQLIEVDKYYGTLSDDSSQWYAQEIVEKLLENSQRPIAKQVQYRNDKRYVVSWNEIEVPSEPVGIPWRDRGNYLITGGTGGLGLIFAKEIAERSKDATLILTGRSRLSAAKQALLKEIERLGTRIVYRQVDVADKRAVDGLIQSIRQDFGGLNGIIHSAGVIQDNFIIKKSKEEFYKVLAPKVSGVVNLDQASKDLALDFFILFSAVGGALGNIGQADYTTANAFLDAYARYRNALVASKQCQGLTLAINWPFWQEGGMRIDPETAKMMGDSTGMTGLPTLSGIQALYQGVASGKDQVMVLEGDKAKLRNFVASYFENEKQIIPGAERELSSGLDDEFYLNIVEDIIKGKLSAEQFVDFTNTVQRKMNK
ncbi:Polyketide synthase PksN (fragment) [Candidatus Desulfosporosinus infrequens]|uniref:Polyketide synthase PksN n=1 Tax=Candidatus Desulfosporosinus infrequens TaxID=2043169 RepID=A0A2U3KRY1_9FIRM